MLQFACKKVDISPENWLFFVGLCVVSMGSQETDT